MTDELPKYGSGERGTWIMEPIDAPQTDEEREPPKINHEMLYRESERGAWVYNRKTKQIEPYTPPPKVHVHSVIQDTLTKPLMFMGDDKGTMFDSRSALIRHTKNMGFEIIGHEKPTEIRRDKKKEREQRIDDIKRAMADNRNGNAPLTEWEKEQCLREQRELEAYKRRQKTRWAH